MLARIGREIKLSFVTAFPKPIWLIIPASLVGVSAPLLWKYGFQDDPPTDKDPLYFLLGTLPETLGTVFVLAFTLTFVAAQIASNYSRVLFRRVLGPWALWYAIPFATGILLPLFLLKGTFFLWSVHISLLLGAYCVISLLPFAVAVRGLLSISNAIIDEAGRILTVKSYSEGEPYIADIVHISMGALGLRDFEVFECGVEQLHLVATTCEVEEFRLLICSAIRTMIVRSSNDNYASEVLLKAIAEVGLRQWSNIEYRTKLKLTDEVLGAYLSVEATALWDRTTDINLICQQALCAIDQGQTEVVRRLQTLLNTIAERTILGLPDESVTSRSALQTFGELMKRELTSSLPQDELHVLVISSVMMVEYLGIKAKASAKNYLANLAVIQLQDAASTANSLHSDTIRHFTAAIASVQRS